MNAKPHRTLKGWKMGIVALGLCAMAAGPVAAQDTAVTTTTTTETEERGSFPWGLLGLLGLAGLLGRGRKEEVHTHRETVRPVETHRPVTTTTRHTTGEVDRTVIRPDETGGLHGGGTAGGGG
ncbi:MAG: hypothetical protein ICV87_11635, partial [Gemmatimonadetes bacterium]|nr:hypothetical protein [Gemmatimonadota bacterium]